MPRNPVMPHRLWAFDPHTVAMLNAMEAAFRPLLATAEQLREAGQHEKATVLEVMAETIIDRLEDISAEVFEGGDIDYQRGEIEPGIEEQFAAIWYDYLIWRAGGRSARSEYAYGTTSKLASLLSGEFRHSPCWETAPNPPPRPRPRPSPTPTAFL
jgi:hypothetical protein